MISSGIPRLEGKLEERFATIMSRVERYAPAYDREMLARAYEFAAFIHRDQLRRSKEPYIIHPLEVANILAELEVDESTIAAGFLHDTIEDGKLERADGTVTPVTRADIAERFGNDVATLVEGVTKLGALHFGSREERQAENLRKLLIATARDIRVILIKLADRFHNTRTLMYMDKEVQERIADETLHIYAPIAHRLGVWKIKWELEDSSLRALQPDIYQKIQKLVNRTRAERDEVVSTAIIMINQRLQMEHINGDVVGRPKHFYSIYNKMRTQEINFDQILDLEAVRVIVDTIPECYAVLGEIHNLWLPLRDQFTDYIAMPKPNLYQSLHTKVAGPHGMTLEVQIRTREMHRIAEVGIAAHWRYKEGGSRDVEFEKKLSWVRGLLEYEADAKSGEDWLESLKTDLFKDQVFVFTPAGDIIDLPAGSTPVDFAYRIHTDLGARCAGAKVNGRMVPINFKFSNNDVVEIIVKANQKPSLDWLGFVATHQAKTRIKAYFRKANREDNVIRGRHALEEECKREGVPQSEYLKADKLEKLAVKMNMATGEDVFALIGYGELTAEGVLHRLREDIPRRSIDELRVSSGPIAEQGRLPIQVPASGIDGILFNLSKCCQPIPGDAIVGYVTRGKGVTIHRIDCPNLRQYRENPEEAQRLLILDWEESSGGVYQAELEITSLDRVGLAADIYAIFSETKTNIRSARMNSDAKHRTMHFILHVETSGLLKLQEIIARVGNLSDVLQVHRRHTGS